MPVIMFEDELQATVEVTPEVATLLNENRILRRQAANGEWTAGGQISFLKTLELEPYCHFVGGDRLWKLGAFSYSYSNLPLAMTVGRYCSISWNVGAPSPRHPLEALSTSPVFYEFGIPLVSRQFRDRPYTPGPAVPNPQRPDPVVGNDVWIGEGARLNPGIRIGDGAVVSSGSVVSRDVEPYAIVGGNPASLIRYRFPEDLRRQLQQTAWWRHSPPWLAQFPVHDPQKFVEVYLGASAEPEIWSPPKLALWDAIKHLPNIRPRSSVSTR